MLIGEEIIQGHEAHLVKYNYHSKKLLESSKFLLFKKMNISQDEEESRPLVSLSGEGFLPTAEELKILDNIEKSLKQISPYVQEGFVQAASVSVKCRD